MPYNFVDDGFHTNKLCSSLSLNEMRFYTENSNSDFLSLTLGGLGATKFLLQKVLNVLIMEHDPLRWKEQLCGLEANGE